jgi:hypothetical protein
VPSIIVALLFGLLQWYNGFRNYVQTVVFESALALAWLISIFFPDNSVALTIVGLVWVCAAFFTMLYTGLKYQSTIAGVFYSMSAIMVISIVGYYGLFMIQVVEDGLQRNSLGILYALLYLLYISIFPVITHLVSSIYLKNK